jgi:hypothetical protein
MSTTPPTKPAFQMETPLPSAWDSAIVRNLAYAVLGLIATIAADFFGLDATLIMEKGGRSIEALLTFLIVAVPLYLAYRARKYKATPPITLEAAAKAVDRESAIAAARTEEQKLEAAK